MESKNFLKKTKRQFQSYTTARLFWWNILKPVVSWTEQKESYFHAYCHQISETQNHPFRLHCCWSLRIISAIWQFERPGNNSTVFGILAGGLAILLKHFSFNSHHKPGWRSILWFRWFENIPNPISWQHLLFSSNSQYIGLLQGFPFVLYLFANTLACEGSCISWPSSHYSHFFSSELGRRKSVHAKTISFRPTERMDKGSFLPKVFSVNC